MPFLFNPLSRKHRAFRSYAFDFTTLVLSINSAWIMKNHWCNAINLIMQRNKHTMHLKRDRICKDGNRLLRTRRILFIYWSKVRWVYKEENRTMNTRKVLYQQAVDSIPNEFFSQCLQSSLSICQTLLSHRLAVRPLSLRGCTWFLRSKCKR